jgi:hypothetical protein
MTRALAVLASTALLAATSLAAAEKKPEILPGEEVVAGVEPGDAVHPAAPAPPRRADEGEGPFERLIIRGATLIDGTGAPPVGPMDIVIEGTGSWMYGASARRACPSRGAGAPAMPSGRSTPRGCTSCPVSSTSTATSEVRPRARRPSTSTSSGWPTGSRRSGTRDPGTASTGRCGTGSGRRGTRSSPPASGPMSAPARGGTRGRCGMPGAGPGVRPVGEVQGGRWLQAWLAPPTGHGGAPGARPAAWSWGPRRTTGQLGVSRMNVLDAARLGLGSMEHWYGLPEALFDDRTSRTTRPTTTTTTSSTASARPADSGARRPSRALRAGTR